METQIFSENEIELAAQKLREGELIAFPTETVYGLGASLFLPESIEAIFSVKGRPQDNPLIAHIAQLSSLEKIAIDLPRTFYPLVEAFFPGPLTLVVKKSRPVPSIVSAGLPTLAVRSPQNPIARDLIEAVGEPLVAPSANLSGTPSSTCAQHVLADFSGKIAGIVDGGACSYGIESTVLDLVSFPTPTLLRPGVVTQKEIEEVLGFPIATYKKGPQASPGMRYRHYAPRAPVYLFHDWESLKQNLSQEIPTYVLSTSSLSIPHTLLEPNTLYSSLREADQMGYHQIFIWIDRAIDDALKNRLEKMIDESPCPQTIRKC